MKLKPFAARGIHIRYKDLKDQLAKIERDEVRPTVVELYKLMPEWWQRRLANASGLSRLLEEGCVQLTLVHYLDLSPKESKERCEELRNCLREQASVKIEDFDGADRLVLTLL